MITPPKNIEIDKSCWNCKYFKLTKETSDGELISIISDSPHCPAFPNKIPTKIWDNGHYKVLKNQKTDLVFERKEIINEKEDR